MAAGTFETPYGAFSLRVFLGAFLIAGLALVGVVYSLPPQYVVRSAFEVGSTFVGEKLEALEPPDQVVKQISSLYLPDSLATLANKGTPINMLRQLEGLKVDTISRFITLQNQGDAAIQPYAKELQSLILDQVIQRRAAVTGAVRSGYDIKLNLLRRDNAVWVEQAKTLSERIKDTRIRLDEARNQNTLRQEALSEKIKASSVEKDLARRTILEAEVRELQDQVSHGQLLAKDLGSEQLTASRDLGEVNKQIADQNRSIALMERDSQMVVDPRQSLAPSVLPIPTGPRRLYLLLAAIAVSFFIGIGMAALWQRLRPVFGSHASRG